MYAPMIVVGFTVIDGATQYSAPGLHVCLCAQACSVRFEVELGELHPGLEDGGVFGL